jgi:hypothetical protein
VRFSLHPKWGGAFGVVFFSNHEVLSQRSGLHLYLDVILINSTLLREKISFLHPAVVTAAAKDKET